MTSTIYLASSWRNIDQQDALFRLRTAGHKVYDFRNPLDRWDTTTPSDGSEGFTWASIDPAWQQWSPWSFRQALATPEAVEGFGRDWTAMKLADTCVLLLPCGRSTVAAAHALGRRIIAFELEEEHCHTIVERISNRLDLGGDL